MTDKFFSICKQVITICCISLFLTIGVDAQQPEKITIYLDADRTRHSASAIAIERGIKTAFAQHNNELNGIAVEFVTTDHRGNSKRSKLNMDKAFADPSTLLVVAGMHSPPLIKYRDHINENKMLTLVPWAAGGPITRHPSPDNWVFRLSVDDTKAGSKIADFAISQKQCLRPHLLLEQTPWGQSNQSNMSQAIEQRVGQPPSLSWFNWGISLESARIMLRSIASQQSSCILFVGNASDGNTFANAMASIDKNQRLPVYSHWGITGGDFAEVINAEIRSKFELYFLQTCFSFVSSKQDDFSLKALSDAQAMFPDVQTSKHLQAPTGFIHAYDFAKVLIAATKQIDVSKDMSVTRARLKHALENLNTPVKGLIKTYNKPFSVFSNANPDAHEALGAGDLCMAQFGESNEIVLLD